MNADEPNDAPHDDAAASTPNGRRSNKFATCILFVGLAILAYGAIAFWVINALPPNGGAQGRLPSLYVMAGGISVALVGLIAKDLRVGRKANRPTAESRKGIPTSYGILGLVAIVVLLIFAISRM